MSTSPLRITLMGMPIDHMDRSWAAHAVVHQRAWLVTANLDHLRRYSFNRSQRNLIQEANLVVADGQPLVWAARWARQLRIERVCGSDLITDIAREADISGKSIFLIGGEPGAAGMAAKQIADAFPSLKISGVVCPPFGYEHDMQYLEDLDTRIARAKPAVVLVALGFPKQDLLIRRLKTVWPNAGYIGVGMGFGFISGQVDRAPLALQKIGMEWSYRLAQEPRRLFVRYLVLGLPFAVVLFTWSILRRGLNCLTERAANRHRSRSPGGRP